MTIEETLGYSFKTAAYLERALTRKAYANELKQQHKDCEDQEIYRTLGDAVLKLVLVDLLIKSGSDTRDDITLKKKDLKNREQMKSQKCLLKQLKRLLLQFIMMADLRLQRKTSANGTRYKKIISTGNGL